MTATLNRDEALAVASRVAGDRAAVGIHEHDEHWGVRIWGCSSEDAAKLAPELEAALGISRDRETGRTTPAEAGFSAASGFACVWMA